MDELTESHSGVTPNPEWILMDDTGLTLLSTEVLSTEVMVEVGAVLVEVVVVVEVVIAVAVAVKSEVPVLFKSDRVVLDLTTPPFVLFFPRLDIFL